MRKVLSSLIMFISAFSLFVTVVYAWYAISTENQVQPVSLEVMKTNVDLDVEYGKNGGSYESFNEPAEINAYLRSILPGDSIDIRVTVANYNELGSPDMEVAIKLLNIRSSETDHIYDMTDFFSLENANIELTWYDSLSNYTSGIFYQEQNVLITPIDESVIMYQGLPLETYRLSNLFDHYDDQGSLVVENNISILESTPIPSQHILVIEFSFILDAYTPDQGGFQDGELLIDGLYSELDQS